MKYTPAIQQYLYIKDKHKDCVLFFRLGDFYEVFFDDAKLCSKSLDLVLTSKNKNSENPIPMAGIPYHSADKYIKRLIDFWHKVAIAEQTSDPVPGKIVEREVVGIATPWTFISENESKDFSYIASIVYREYKDWENYHISWWDFTVWEYNTKSFKNFDKVQNFLGTLRPVEIVFDVDLPNKENLKEKILNNIDVLVSVYEVPVDVEKYITEQCKIQTIYSYGQALEKWRLSAFGLILNYIKNTQKNNISNISNISFHGNDDRVLIDDITIKNLEIFNSNYENNEKYSLVWVLDNCKTSAGSRLLRWLLMNPIKEKQKLENRINNIDYYLKNLENTKRINNVFWSVSDLQRIISTILYKKINPLVFVKLRSLLEMFFDKNNWISKLLLDELIRLGLKKNNLDKVEEIYKYLKKILKEDEFIKNDMDFISDWFDENIDKLRKIAYNSDEMLMDYQQELVNNSKINNVKLKYVTNQWYFIEITNKDIKLFEENLDSLSYQDKEKFSMIRRNTLKWAQRYTSEFLERVQEKVLEAKESLAYHEFFLLEELKNSISLISNDIYEFANKIAWLDFYASHAIYSKENNLTKPMYVDKWNLEIEDWRHLVVEKYLEKDQQFIPNNLFMDNFPISKKGRVNDGFLHIITGPNMWWKSTYLRQNALILLMAHCGFFVPASVLKTPILDWIFARIGSGDILAKNQSTFMTEMVEVANILNNATENSFIIFDELWRWTSTYDWLALTKAILEYVYTKIWAKTLIATHYHELIKMEEEFENIKNYSVSVYETEKDVVFMKKIAKWGSNKSYGLDVAKLAGIPQKILENAQYNLDSLENKSSSWKEKNKDNLFVENKFIKVNDPKHEKIKSIINSFDINNITPLQSMQLLEKIREIIKS